MKSLSMTAIALTLASLTISAHAADKLVPRLAYKAPPLTASDWSGFYLGINGGGGDGPSLIGGTLGYNYQAGGVVLGVEGDIDATVAKTSFDPDYVGTVRGRIGLAFDQFLPYLTAGLAFDDNTSGGAFGGGMEFRLTQSVSMKAEYLHLNLGGSDNIVRLGLNWRFNPNAGLPLMSHY